MVFTVSCSGTQQAQFVFHSDDTPYCCFPIHSIGFDLSTVPTLAHYPSLNKLIETHTIFQAQRMINPTITAQTSQIFGLQH